MPCREQSAAYPGTLPVPQAPIVCKGLATRQGQGHSSQIRGVALMDASRLCHDVQASLGAEHYRGADDACVDVRRWARAPSACVYVRVVRSCVRAGLTLCCVRFATRVCVGVWGGVCVRVCVCVCVCVLVAVSECRLCRVECGYGCTRLQASLFGRLVERWEGRQAGRQVGRLVGWLAHCGVRVAYNVFVCAFVCVLFARDSVCFVRVFGLCVFFVFFVVVHDF